MRYLFGDTDEATRRLQVVAEVFAGSTAAFLQDSVDFRPKSAVDLGCGPGFTTHLVAESLACERVVGLDSSEHFIGIAGKTSTESVCFLLHDVTEVPFPIGPADLIFCRLLLTHLAEPLEALRDWGNQLGNGGLLLVEEVEWIRTGSPLFGEYLEMVEAMLADQGSHLFVGPIIDRFEDSRRLRRRAGGVRKVRVSNRNAARMFLLNLRAWQHRPFVRDNYSSRVIAGIEAELSALIGESSAGSDIEWGIRSLVFERVGD